MNIGVAVSVNFCLVPARHMGYHRNIPTERLVCLSKFFWSFTIVPTSVSLTVMNTEHSVCFLLRTAVNMAKRKRNDVTGVARCN